MCPRTHVSTDRRAHGPMCLRTNPNLTLSDPNLTLSLTPTLTKLPNPKLTLTNPNPILTLTMIGPWVHLCVNTSVRAWAPRFD